MWDSVDIGAMGGNSPVQKEDASQSSTSKEERSLPPAASKSYSVASIWERAAALTDTQQRSIEVVSSACAQRPFPSHLTDAPATPVTDGLSSATTRDRLSSSDVPPQSPHGESVDLSFAGTSFEDVVLQNSSEFYKWLSVLEAARATETESKYQRHAAVLDAHLTSCDDLLSTIDGVLELFASLKEGQRAVSNRTAALHVTCDRLVNEREALVSAADALRSKLAYFDELEQVSAQFRAASISLENSDVLSALEKLDKSLAFVSSHPHYADAAAYNVKFKQLQGRALAAVRAKVQQSLRTAAQTVQRSSSGVKLPSGATTTTTATTTITEEEITSSSSSQAAAGVVVMDSGAETTLLFVRFRAAVEPALKPLLQGVEARAGSSPEYARLLRECQTLHSETRLGLMRAPVAAHLASLKGQPLPAVLRSGCAFLLHVAQLEMQLFEQLFPASTNAAATTHAPPSSSSPSPSSSSLSSGLGTAAGLAPVMDPLCSMLYDTLRPALVGLKDIDTLCELAYVLQTEVLGDTIGSAALSPVAMTVFPSGTAATVLLEPVLRRVVGDVQERLTYRAQAFIRESVAGFSPTDADLDYPALLSTATISNTSTTSDAKEQGEGAEKGENEDEKSQLLSSSTTDEAEAAEYAGWYPPVQRSLLLLSKLYRTVPQKAFNGLAHEAVAAAAAAVQDAAREVTKAAGPLHGQLFTIRQLLILREQIAPFEADFAVVERALDFSHVKDYLRRTLSGQLPLFSFSSNNAVMQLVSRGTPRMSESQIDAKKDLERQLKATCEAFIMAATKLTVDSALTFLTKVTAVRVAGGAGEDGAGEKPLREQAFAAPERVAEVTAAVTKALNEELPAAAAALRVYLPGDQTRGALFKPIRSNVVEAHAQLQSLLEAEYTEEEIAAAALPSVETLEAALDAMA